MGFCIWSSITVSRRFFFPSCLPPTHPRSLNHSLPLSLSLIRASALPVPIPLLRAHRYAVVHAGGAVGAIPPVIKSYVHVRSTRPSSMINSRTELTLVADKHRRAKSPSETGRARLVVKIRRFITRAKPQFRRRPSADIGISSIPHTPHPWSVRAFAARPKPPLSRACVNLGENSEGPLSRARARARVPFYRPRCIAIFYEFRCAHMRLARHKNRRLPSNRRHLFVVSRCRSPFRSLSLSSSLPARTKGGSPRV